MRKRQIGPIADSTWLLVAATLLTLTGVFVLTMQPAGAQDHKPTLAITPKAPCVETAPAKEEPETPTPIPP